MCVWDTNPAPPLVGQCHVCIELGWIAHDSPPSRSRWLRGVRIVRDGDPKIFEREFFAVEPVGVVVFRDDARMFPSSTHAPCLCHASARYADQFEGPLRMLLVKGVARY